MKLRNLNYKLIKLEYLESKLFQKNTQTFNIENNLDQFELHLKKALSVIFQYHLNNKKIYFVGIPTKVQMKYSKTLKKTKHLFLPKFYWVKGLLTNTITVFKYLKKKIDNVNRSGVETERFKKYFSVKEKPDLIVIFITDLDHNITEEASGLKIPVIALQLDAYYNDKILYKIPGNFQITKRKNTNFFFSLLYTILRNKNNLNVKKKKT